MTVDLSANEFLDLCSREKLGEIHIQNVFPHGARYEVTYAITEPDSAEPAALPTEPNRQDDSGSGIEAVEQRHINPQEQLRSAPDVERKGQTEAQKDGGVEKAGENAPGDAKLLACPTCGTLNETDHCEICEALSRAYAARQRKAYDYAQSKAANRRKDTIYDPAGRD